MKTESISFCKNIEQKSEYYEEETLISPQPNHAMSSFLDISAFGKSLFKAGARIPITSAHWVMQLHISGRAYVKTQETGYLMQPGDLLVVPPKCPHTYMVPKRGDMRKYFMIFRPGPLPDMLLGTGCRIRGGETDFRRLFDAIFSDMDTGTPEALENLSTDLYHLIYTIRNQTVHESSIGNFRKCLREAACDIASGITLDELASRFGMGTHSLIRRFKAETGQTPIRYMIALRLQHAEQLLLLSSMSIAEIAAACGYASPAFFAAEFKKHRHMTPSQARRNAHAQPGPPRENSSGFR